MVILALGLGSSSSNPSSALAPPVSSLLIGKGRMIMRMRLAAHKTPSQELSKCQLSFLSFFFLFFFFLWGRGACLLRMEMQGFCEWGSRMAPEQGFWTSP